MRTLSHVAQVSSVCLHFHPWSSACAFVLECSLHPVSLLLLQVFLPPLPESFHGADENSMEDPLCNSSFGSMVSLDYVTPDTGYESTDMELADTNERNLATSSDIYFQNALEDTASFPNPDIDDDELAEFLAVVVDRTGQPVEVRSNSDQFSCDIRNLKSAQSQFPSVTQPERMFDQTGRFVEERIVEERESSNAQIRTLLDEQRSTIIAEYGEKVLHHELLAAQAKQDRKILQEELLRQRQLQNHVWSANFCGEIREITIPSKSSYFFMVLWHGWSCKEVCGTTLWVGKQDDWATLQSIYSMHRWPPLQRGRNKICWRIVKYMLSNCSEMFIFGTNWTTWYSMISKYARAIHHKMDQGHWQTPVSIDFHIFITQVNINNIVMWIMLLNSADWDCFRILILQEMLEDSKSTSGGTLCVFGSHTFVPISWMCKKQTLVSHSSRESEITSLDAGWRMDGIFAFDLWDLIVTVLHGNTHQNE